MKEYKELSVRANPINPAAWLPRALIYYPTKYANLAAAKADIANLHVILYYHGSGETGTNLDDLKANDLPKNLALGNIDKDWCIIICPQTVATFTGNQLTGTKDICDVEYAGALSYNTTGLSMGGQACYAAVAKYPTFFTTMGCLAGNDFTAINIEYGGDSSAMYAAIQTSLTDVRHWHGEDDISSNDYPSGVDAVNRWSANGFPNEITFITMPSPAAHNIWPDVYYNDDLYFTWLESKILTNNVVDRDSGFTFTNTELLAWRDRAINGPYKTTGDKVGFTQSPGSWDDVVARADAFMNDTVTEYWDGAFTTDEENTYSKGHYLLAAAFYGLIKEDNSYRIKAKNAVLTQIANTSNPDFESYIGLATIGNGFHFSNFTTRLFYAFDYTYDLWTTSEISAFDAYMERATALWRDIRDHYPGLNWPNRESDDYSTVGWWALTGALYSDDSSYYDEREYTHTEADGTRPNLIRKCHRYGNGAASLMLSDFLWALYKNNTTRINQAKRWIKEWLMFAVWPDGMTSEGLRNDYGRPSTGVHYYGAIVLEQVLQVTEQLRRRGDLDLYEYSTSDGIWGSEGGTKNIKLVVDTLIECMQSDVEKYFWLVQEDRRLVPLNGTYRFKPEQAIARANLYYNDSNIQNAYKNALANSFAYSAAYGGPSYTFVSNGDLNFWIGNGGTDVGLPLTVYEMESVINLAPIANAGSDQSIDVAVTTLDGTGSSDPDGLISSYLWEQVNGPNTANILTPSGSSSIVNNLIVGDYVFRLTVTDNDGLTNTDTVIITVNPVISTINANARVLL